MLRNEFEQGYATRSGLTVEELRQHMVSLPCGCGMDDCDGWASIALAPSLLLHHLAFSLPTREKLMEMSVTELRSVVQTTEGLPK